jgi:hypothetical protein
MMSEAEIARLAGMANHLRPDWPNASLYTFIARNLAARAYRDVAVALAYVACDTTTATPKRILEAGPWWQATQTSSETYRPPRKDEECPRHAGNYVDSCRGCAADQRVGDSTAPGEPRKPDRSTQLAELRRLHREAAAALCTHGIKPELCADHDPRRQPAEQETA